MGEIGRHAGWVAENTDASPSDEIEAVFAEDVEAALYGHQLTLHHAQLTTHFPAHLRTCHLPTSTVSP